ncbi:AMP-binding protein [Actinoplanes sp. NPDC051346]|uniref:AMP-binding protein n=1 Tax=Actinoplanes sp. NPDC051346 TaxID=3155048 RepID=UPI0034399FFE
MKPQLAMIEGPPAPTGIPMNLVEVLTRAAEIPGPSVRFVRADGTESALSYADLLDRAARVLHGLRAAGARPGDRLLVASDSGRDLIVGTWAGILGTMPVIPTDLSTRPDLRTLLRVAAPRWVLTGHHGDHVAFEPENTVGRPVGTVTDLERGPADTQWHNARPDDPALIAMTAGTTGSPKAVLLTHGALTARSAATIADNRLGAGTTTVNWMPVDHVGGLVMFHLRDMQAGGVQVHVDRAVVLGDPLRLLDLVDRHRAAITWATTSALDLIAGHAEAASRSWDLSCLTYVMNGGEPVRARTVRRFTEALARFGMPPTAVRPGWGMSETAGGVVDLRVDARTLPAESRWTPVGRPHSGVGVRVVDDNGAVVAEGVVGRLQVRTPTGPPKYADGNHPLTPDGWIDTGDLAFVEDGSLTVTGSTADAIVVDGVLHHAHELESTVSRLPFVDATQTAAALLIGADGGSELVVAYRPAAAVPDAEQRIRAAVEAAHGLTVHRVVPVPAGRLPRTRTGKPQRARLAALLADWPAATSEGSVWTSSPN